MMHCRRRHLAVFILLWGFSASVKAQPGVIPTPQSGISRPALGLPAGPIDIERDLGCVPDNPDPAVATANAQKINAAFDAMHPRGAVTLANGQSVPVLYGLTAPAKEFFIQGELRTAARVGGSLHGGGGRSYLLGSLDYGPRGIGGAVTRITRIDGENGGAVLRLRGAGFDLQNVDLRGRRMPRNVHSAMGTKTPMGIALEGRASPSTGKHSVHNITIGECSQAIAFLASHVGADGQVARAEGHADSSWWGHVVVVGCDTAVFSENQQAVGHHFASLQVNVVSTNPEVVVFDLERGGLIKAEYVKIVHPRATLFRVRDFSPNTSRLDAHIMRDRFGNDVENQRLTLFEFVGDRPVPYKKWSVRVSGHISDSPTQPSYKPDEVIKLNGVPGEDIWLDLHNLPGEVAEKYPWGGRR
jgi:hypothetical protein